MVMQIKKWQMWLFLENHLNEGIWRQLHISSFGIERDHGCKMFQELDGVNSIIWILIVKEAFERSLGFWWSMSPLWKALTFLNTLTQGITLVFEESFV